MKSDIKNVAIIGTGVIGAGWIIRCLAHNKRVVAFDKDLKLKKRLIAEIKRTWPYVKKLFNKKKLNLKNFTYVTSIEEALKKADFIQECATENYRIKTKLISIIDKYAKPNATEEEVYKAAELSMCIDFIDKLESKYQTIIGENGVRLSGGEKQRISIARAMIKKSSIILLDEATSSLDTETESKIQEALNTLTKNKTTIVIAHRLSTVLNSNNIYLIDSGRVVDNGRHEDLLIKSELYKNFYEKQIKKYQFSTLG